MKKGVALWLCISMIFFLAACGKREEWPIQDSMDKSRIELQEVSEVETESLLLPEEEEEETEESEAEQPEEPVISQKTEPETHSDAAWKEFLRDYEAWVDSYIALLKKYEANPSDMSVLSDYLKMMEQLEDWTEQSEAIEEELEDPAALYEYSLELLRISEKLAKAAY